jgi:hypothetical protein
MIDALIYGTLGGSINMMLKKHLYLPEHKDTIKKVIKGCPPCLDPQKKLQEWHLNFLTACREECAGLW